jgi:hypothetical protein
VAAENRPDRIIVLKEVLTEHCGEESPVQLDLRADKRHVVLLDNEDFAVTRLHKRHKLLVIRLEVFVGHKAWCLGFKSAKAGHGHFQYNRVEKDR